MAAEAAPAGGLKAGLEALLNSDEGKAKLQDLVDKIKEKANTPEAQEAIAKLKEKLASIDKDKLKEGLQHLGEELEKPENKEKLAHLKEQLANLDTDKLKAVIQNVAAAAGAANKA